MRPMLLEALRVAAYAVGVALGSAATYAIVRLARRAGALERLGELLAEKEALEKRLLRAEEELAEARSRCEREKREIARQCERRVEEALAEARAALALYRAVREGKVEVRRQGCDDVLVQVDGMVLCRKGRELEVIE